LGNVPGIDPGADTSDVLDEAYGDGGCIGEDDGFEATERKPALDIGRGGASLYGGGVGGIVCCPLIPGDINGCPLLFPLFLQRLRIPLTEMIDPERSERVVLFPPSSELIESAEKRLDMGGGGVTGLPVLSASLTRLNADGGISTFMAFPKIASR
jgi:hypothetical protein